MKIIAFVGSSGCGKTRLIALLIPELKRRGLAVAVVKHCGHGFDLNGPDKDSSKFLAAGADGVALAGPDRTAVLCDNQAGSAGRVVRDNRVVCDNQVGHAGRVVRDDRVVDLGALARREFAGADIVLVEGGKSDPSLRKIEVLRPGVSKGLMIPPEELAAIVADRPIAGAGVPHFSPDQVAAIADWLAGTRAKRGRRP
jgi:molybdopterin-guanine dinucleotide biosynthesis protein